MKFTTQHVLYEQYSRIRVVNFIARKGLIQICFHVKSLMMQALANLKELFAVGWITQERSAPHHRSCRIESVFEAVLQKSVPTQIRQLLIYVSNSKG